MKKSTTTPFMAPPDYGHSLTGLGVNLLSVDLSRALVFQRDVLAAELLHADEDLADRGVVVASWDRRVGGC